RGLESVPKVCYELNETASFAAPFLFSTQELNGNDLRISSPSLYRSEADTHCGLAMPKRHAKPLSRNFDRILTWYYSGATNGGIGREQGASPHPEKGAGSLRHYTRQQSRVRRGGWWGATQAGQETRFVAHRRRVGHPRLQGPSDPGRQDARRAGDEEGSQAGAALVPTSLRASTSATTRRRDVWPPMCSQLAMCSFQRR